MAKFAHTDGDGLVLGFYDDEVHQTIPQPNFAVSDADWRDHITGATRLVADMANGTVDGTAPVVLPLSVPVARRVAMQQLETAIAAVVDWFTDGVSPQEVASWGSKAEIAQAHLDGTPQPLIAVEASFTGEDPTRSAARIVAVAELYKTTIFAVAGIRRAATAAIAAATDLPAIEAGLAAATSDLNQLAIDAGITPS